MIQNKKMFPQKYCCDYSVQGGAPPAVYCFIVLYPRLSLYVYVYICIYMYFANELGQHQLRQHLVIANILLVKYIPITISINIPI